MFHYSAIPVARWQCVTEAVPPHILVGWACRLFTLMNLSWQYIDTVCDLCIQMRLRETKPLVRAIRQIRREYDIFRARSIDDESVREETSRSESFEESHDEDFRKLFFGLQNEIGKLGLTPQHRDLVLATQQALTVMDAVRVYARRLDRRLLEEYGLLTPDCCLVQNDFMRLYGLVPQFAGDQYQPNLEARRLTATILANRMDGSLLNVRQPDGSLIQA